MLRLIDRTPVTGLWEFVRDAGDVQRLGDDLPIGFPTQLAGMTAALDEMNRYPSRTRLVFQTETEFGTVMMSGESVGIDADAGDLRRWTQRPGMSWPCSTLEDLPSGISVGFDSGGLCDIDVPDTVYDPETGTYDDDGTMLEIDAGELDAWSSDVLALVIPESHPCHFVTVGQFNG